MKGRGMSVIVGMNTDGNVASKTLLSLARMFNFDQHVFESRLIMVDGGCADFAGNRNKLVRSFLETGVDYLMIVDADMVWRESDWALLRDSVTDDTPIVAGLYFVDGDPVRPCGAILDHDGRATPPVITEDSEPLIRVSAAGLGFSLIHRSVFVATADYESDHPWFQHGWVTPAGETMPEDYAFAYRLQEAGIPLYLNTKVRLGHVKTKVVGWEDYAKQA